MTTEGDSARGDPAPDITTGPNLSIDGYAVRRFGDVLSIKPACWPRNPATWREDDPRMSAIIPLIERELPRSIIVDLTDVPYLPANRLGLLVRMAKLLRSQEDVSRLVLANCPPTLRDQFRMGRLETLFSFADDEEQALARCGGTKS